MSDEITLYQYGGRDRLPSLSPPCLKVLLALRLLELPHRVVNLGGPGSVRRHSPTGRVPVIEVGERRLAESVAILDFLQDEHADAAPWPDETAARAMDRVWDCYATDTLYWLGFYQRWLVPATRKALFDRLFGEGFSLNKLATGLYAGTGLRRRANAQGVGRRPAVEIRAAFLRGLDTVVDGLGAGPFLGGRDRPGRGDLSVAAHVAQLTWARDLPPVAKVLAERPALSEHVDGVFAACGLESP